MRDLSLTLGQCVGCWRNRTAGWQAPRWVDRATAADPVPTHLHKNGVDRTYLAGDSARGVPQALGKSGANAPCLRQ